MKGKNKFPITVREICNESFKFSTRAISMNTFYIILLLNHHLTICLKGFHWDQRQIFFDQCQSFSASVLDREVSEYLVSFSFWRHGKNCL